MQTISSSDNIEEQRMTEETMVIAEIVESPSCIAADDGQRVYERILGELQKGHKVRLSFKGIEDVTSAFLNAAVGQLYGTVDKAKLKQLMLPPIEAEPDDLALLKRVVERAVEFFEKPDHIVEAEREVLGDDD